MHGCLATTRPFATAALQTFWAATRMLRCSDTQSQFLEGPVQPCLRTQQQWRTTNLRTSSWNSFRCVQSFFAKAASPMRRTNEQQAATASVRQIFCHSHRTCTESETNTSTHAHVPHVTAGPALVVLPNPAKVTQNDVQMNVEILKAAFRACPNKTPGAKTLAAAVATFYSNNGLHHSTDPTVQQTWATSAGWRLKAMMSYVRRGAEAAWAGKQSCSCALQFKV